MTAARNPSGGVWYFRDASNNLFSWAHRRDRYAASAAPYAAVIIRRGESGDKERLRPYVAAVFADASLQAMLKESSNTEDKFLGELMKVLEDCRAQFAPVSKPATAAPSTTGKKTAAVPAAKRKVEVEADNFILLRMTKRAMKMSDTDTAGLRNISELAAVAYKDEELRGPMPSTGEVANDKKKKMLQYAQHVRIAMKFVDMVQRKGVSGDNDGDGASESAQ